VWQAFRDEVKDQGVEVVTVGIDTAGPEACRAFIEAADPQHPSLIDEHHRVAELFGVVNIPNAVWIDEDGLIVRPAETSPAPPSVGVQRAPNQRAMENPPKRIVEMMTHASQIIYDAPTYEAALRDWIEKGVDSEFSLAPAEVIDRSGTRNSDTSRGHAHFEMATHLELAGNHQAAIGHFRMAHELVPDNFAYRRQAWSLEPSVDGPLARFWQGPLEGQEADWPYASDWVTDVKEMGAHNYYAEWTP
jgi:hypothetical protein